MRLPGATCACALAALTLAGTASGAARTPDTPIAVGVNEDAGKYAADAKPWETMAALGLTRNTISVLWDESRPDTIVEQSLLETALAAAKTAGIEIVLDVYPQHSRALTDDAAAIPRFGAFVGQLARTFPQVREYVVMNECNQPRFLNPQFSGREPDSPNSSAAVCGQALAAAYDALKAVDPTIFVWGLGLSPRGNDRPDAVSNSSTSPVQFLAALGDWYRESGRSAPLMDGLDFHPYPIPQSMPFEQGFADPDNATVSNLDRIYQAFYDAFDGTGQRTIGSQRGGGLPVSLNEVGVQTLEDASLGYTGSEPPGAGVAGATATEHFQATWYLRMLNYVACDANVRAVDIFHLVDEPDLGAWQSGLYRLDYSPKYSAGAVRQWLASTGGICPGTLRTWRPTAAGGVAGTVTLARLKAQIAALRKQEARLRAKRLALQRQVTALGRGGARKR